MRISIALGLTLFASPLLAQEDATCGDAQAPCEVDGGVYHAALPTSTDGAPWVLYLHGYGGAATATLANTGFVGGFVDRGYSLILPQGLPYLPNEPTEWSVRDAWNMPRDWDYPRDDVAFLQTVAEDAVSRFSLDPARGVVAGFSRGGSMVWDLACHQPDIAAAFAPVAGGFWEPMAQECAGPVHMQHTHGFSDPVVPLEGRIILSDTFNGMQSDIYAGLQIWRRMMGCQSNANTHSIEDGRWRKSWTGCEHGSLELVLHPGGHGLPVGWTDMMLDWFEALPG